jgi:glycosyltransferase involved in cell wall biosynthesis
VGIVANEFFDPALGRMGGFGWAARRSAECLRSSTAVGYSPLLVVGKGERLRGDGTSTHASGARLVRYEDRGGRYSRRLGHAGLSLFLTIDFRPNYVPVLTARRAPVVVWVRDPWTPEDRLRIATLEIPSSAAVPQGIGGYDCDSLAPFVAASESTVVFASPAPGIAASKASDTYGLEIDDVAFLPNPVEPVAAEGHRTDRPSVAFLARLDPVKRPWVFVELARRLPRVDFLMLGQSHFTGPGSWSPPARMPPNVRLLGHVDGPEKTRILSAAWMLVNPSIHDGLPISFLEALHCGTPIVSCHDPEGVTSRFGIDVGRWDGSGMDALDAFASGIERLLDDEDLRLELGAAGRDWARANHTPESFLAAFTTLTRSLAT